MRRVVIVGRSGSGKSRLARRLGRQLQLPVIHLDQLYWKPGWREPDIAEFRARVAAAIAGDGWISDGSYALTTFDLRLPRADAIVWLERSRVLCTWRVLRRSIGLNKRSEDLPEGCREHLDWTFLKYVWQFDILVRPRIETARRLHGPDVPVIRLRNKREIGAFVSQLASSPL